MFKCEFCGRATGPRVPCAKIVTATQYWRHPFRSRIQKKWGFDKSGKLRMEWVDDPGGYGPQILKERKACPNCAAKWERQKECQSS